MSQPSLANSQRIRTRILIVITVVSSICLIGLIVWRRIPRRRAETPIYQTGPVVNSVAFSSDRESKYLAAALSDGRVLLWETATKHELPVKLPSRLAMHDLAWNPDGTLLTGGFEQHVLSWNVKAAQSKKLPIFPAQVVSIACRPGRGELVISLSNGQLYFVDSRSNEQILLTTGHTGVVKVVRFSPKGTAFVTGGVDGQIVWHDWKTRQVSRTVAAHQHEVSSLAFSADGLKLVSGSWDQTAKTWDEHSEKPQITLKHPGEVAQVGWMEIDIVTTCWDEELRIWNSESGTEIFGTPWNHGSLAFAVQPGKREAVGISADGTWHFAKP
ncbi:MAG: repeat containing protein [Planctomycetaceae bacterium]|nr:repeat containing protein [Planctomycetaceae bacterium]